MKRALLLVASLMCLLGALSLGIGAAWIAQAFGPSSRVMTDLGDIPVRPGAQAIVIDLDRVDASIPYLPVEGTASLLVKPAGERAGDDPADLFIGLAPGTVLDGYLIGGSYSVARLEDDSWTVTPVTGRRELGSTAAVEWTASARGAGPSIRLSGREPISIVILNGDLGRPVAVRAFLVLGVPEASAYQTAAVGLAVLLLVLAITLAYGALVRLRPGKPPEPGSPA
jgi:hypothetical protein